MVSIFFAMMFAVFFGFFKESAKHEGSVWNENNTLIGVDDLQFVCPFTNGEKKSNDVNNLYISCPCNAGLGNVVLTFQHCVWIAAFVGRTLVIPKYRPSRGHNNLKALNQRVFPFDKLFDYSAITKVIPTIETEELTTRFRKDAKTYLPRNLHNNYVINTNNSMYCSPNENKNHRADNTMQCKVFEFWQNQFRNHYTTEVFDLQNIVLPLSRPLLLFDHLNHNSIIRFLSKQEQECYRDMLLQLPFSKPIRDLANEMVVKLGGKKKYSCLHLRRGDLSLMHLRLRFPIEILAEWLERTTTLLPNELIYIATNDQAFIRPLRVASLNISTTKRVMSLEDFNFLPINDEPNDFIAAIEQEVCSFGRLFFHAEVSTFSKVIEEKRKLNAHVEQTTYPSSNYIELFCEEIHKWCYNDTYGKEWK